MGSLNPSGSRRRAPLVLMARWREWFRVLGVCCLINVTILDVPRAGVMARAAAENNITIFDVRADAAFQHYEDIIRVFLKSARVGKQADFCVLGQIASDGTKSAWISWRQGRQIILWDGGESDLRQSRRKILIDKDVVNTEDELRGSSYLVTRKWVEELNETCAREGVSVRIIPRKH